MPTYTGTKRRVITVANPAAGADFSYTVETGARLELINVSFTLVTDGTAGNRVAQVKLTNAGGNIMHFVTSGTNHAASLTKAYYFGATGPATVNNPITVMVMSELNRVVMDAGDIVASLIDTIKATDQLSAIVLTFNQYL